MFLPSGHSQPCCRLMVGLAEVWVSKWCVQDGCRVLLPPGCSMACQATWLVIGMPSLRCEVTFPGLDMEGQPVPVQKGV